MSGYRFGDLTRGVIRMASESRSSLTSNSSIPNEEKRKNSQEVKNEKKNECDITMDDYLPKKNKFQMKQTDIESCIKNKTQDSIDDSSPSVTSGLLSDSVWPDPEPLVGKEEVLVDDVSRLNPTEVERVFQCRNKDDVLTVLRLAAEDNRNVSIRGTRHSMGGHSIVQGGYVIDTLLLNSIEYFEERQEVRVGPGVLWSDLIVFLNKFSRSPRTMQSYSTFSIGGAVSVNAHGITTDYCVSESITEFTLLLHDGSERKCTRDSENEEDRELFSLCIGGYGLFGIIIDITLKVVPNRKIVMDIVETNIDNFHSVYTNVRTKGKNFIEVKLARLNVTDIETISLMIFRRENNRAVQSSLPIEPRTLSLGSQLMYKWLLPSMQGMRFSMERQAGGTSDIGVNVNETNSLMFESALPLSKLSSGFLEIDDTFILQEYFVSPTKFKQWMKLSKDTLLKQYKLVSLLNLTIRYVEEDTTTFLRYAKEPGGMYAFVLYFRLRRTAEADTELQLIHQDLTKITLDCKGTFYLPYRHHYSDSDFHRAYPEAGKFFERKRFYDPHGRFSSLWHRRYESTKATSPRCNVAIQQQQQQQQSSRCSLDESYQLPIVDDRREDSYQNLFLNPDHSHSRQQFFDLFLKNIFNIEATGIVHSTICNAIWNPILGTRDIDVYAKIAEDLKNETSNLATMKKTYRSIIQLSHQKKELLLESGAIFSQLKRLGKLTDYVSIGDHGKMCIPFQQELGLKGQMYIVHNEHSNDIPAILERGSKDIPGKFVTIDYEFPDLSSLPTACCDLVTLNAGLHHFPQPFLTGFIQELYRVLRPGGLVILREHDGVAELIPLLDIAHSIFNALTAVSCLDESKEIRAFRPILEWRKLFENFGFHDSMLYQCENGDPTKDEMMCFIKEGLFVEQKESGSGDGSSIDRNSSISPEVQAMHMITASIPEMSLEILEGMLTSVIVIAQSTKSFITKIKEKQSAGKRFLIDQLISNALDPAIRIMENVQETGASALLKKQDNLLNEYLPDEVFLLISVLMSSDESATGNPMVAALSLELIELFRGPDPPHKQSKNEKDDAVTNKPGISIPDLNEEIWKIELMEIIEALFRNKPEFSDAETFLKQSGLSTRAQVWVQTQITDWSPFGFYCSVVEYVPVEHWPEMKDNFQNIIKNSPPHVTSVCNLENVTTEGTLWYKLILLFLESDDLQPRPIALTMASWIGLNKVVNMWKLAKKNKAKRIRNSNSQQQQKEKGTSYRCTEMETKHLKFHMDNFRTSTDKQASVKEIISVLRNVYKTNNAATPATAKKDNLMGIFDGQNMDFNYYKLAEWLQVEMMGVLSKYAEHTPWYRFPFMAFVRTYYEVLKKSFFVVFNEFGLGKALFSNAFITDFVPGIVMFVLFGQLQLLAFPALVTLGEEASLDQLESQMERLVILTKEPSISEDLETLVEKEPKWWSSEMLHPGLHLIKVPYAKPFSDLILTLAQSKDILAILEISGNCRIQLRVNVYQKSQLNFFSAETKSLASEISLEDGAKPTKMFSGKCQIDGCKVLYSFRLPCDGNARKATFGGDKRQGSAIPPVSFALEVEVPKLLDVLRFCLYQDVEIVQIFDFWGE